MRFIDLFAGIGGFRLALENNGAECVFSSEIDKYARHTYKENFGEFPSGDIRKININDIPMYDMLCAGWPCQNTSSSGDGTGLSGKDSGLFFELAKVIAATAPKIVFLENVTGLLRVNDGKDFETVIEFLKLMRYNVDWAVLDSSDYGVPQVRNRVYFVGIREDLNSHYTFPALQISERGDVEDFLQDSVPEKFYLTNPNIKFGYRDSFVTLTKSYHKGIGNQGRPCVIEEIETGKRYSGIASLRDFSKYMTDYPELRLRMLTPRECARLQGFPDTFKFPVSNKQVYRQTGNSVTVPVIESIYKGIREQVNV